MDTVENQEVQTIEPEENTLETALENVTEEQLEQFDNYEDFVANQASTDATQENATDTEATADTAETTTTTDDTQPETKEETDSTPDSNSELTDAEFRQLITSNLRANHKDYQFDDPNEIRKLVSYGLNYHKKMGEIAPHRKVLKALEQNDLLDPTKLGYAIELLKGDKKAIANLLKEHSVDTYDLPDLEENPYTAGNYLPTDSKVKFDETINTLQESDAGTQVINYIKGIDSESFSQVYNDPTMLEAIANHVDSGLFKDAMTMLDKERALGRVPEGVKDIDAYAYVAKYLEEHNPTKYLPQQPKPRVLGSNRQTQTTQVPKVSPAKASASIPNNKVINNTGLSGIDALLNASDDDLAKYDNWEDYLKANNL